MSAQNGATTLFDYQEVTLILTGAGSIKSRTAAGVFLPGVLRVLVNISIFEKTCGREERKVPEIKSLNTQVDRKSLLYIPYINEIE
jgi:hypothetical protein